MLKERLGNALIDNHIIDNTKLPLFNYGFTVAGLLFANLLTAITVSFFLGTTPYCIIFLVIFAPLRRYSGGFHAGRAIVCFVESQLLIIIAQIFTVKLTPKHFEFFLLLSLICAAIIFLKSPIYSRYKPLTPNQQRIYGKVAKLLSVVYFSSELFFYLLGYTELFLLIFVALFVQGLLLFIPERKHIKH